MEAPQAHLNHRIFRLHDQRKVGKVMPSIQSPKFGQGWGEKTDHSPAGFRHPQIFVI